MSKQSVLLVASWMKNAGKMEIFEKREAPSFRFQRILIVGNWNALLSGEGSPPLHHLIGFSALGLRLIYAWNRFALSI